MKVNRYARNANKKNDILDEKKKQTVLWPNLSMNLLE